MGNEMKKLFNKLMAKLGYAPMSGLNALISIIKSNMDSAEARLYDRDQTIRELREELRQEKLTLSRLNYHLDEIHFSRFIAISEYEGRKILRKVTEAQISNAIDMADCYEDDSQYFYLDDDGKLYPVTFGGVDRHVSPGELDEFYAENPTIIFSQSGAMRANGKTVGYVSYTDH